MLALADRAAAAAIDSELVSGLGIDLHVVDHDMTMVGDALRAIVTGKSLYVSKFTSRRFARALGRLLADRHYDVVQAEFSYMAPYRRLVRSPTKWLLDQHNLEFLISERLSREGTVTGRSRLYRTYAARERRLRTREELDACRQADRVVTVSDVDAEVLRARVRDIAIDVVPNGVDPEVGAWSAPPDGPPVAVFVAKMDYRPNIDAAIWFCTEILPLIQRRRPDLLVKIIGPNPPPSVQALAGPKVRVTGWVPDVREHLREATLSVVPLRAGSGTRLKILESMAVGRPVVSTSIGAEGIDAAPGREIELADDAQAFAGKVTGLLDEPERARAMALDARRLVEGRYTWAAASKALQQTYETMLPA
jgi:glycosyltransferase involved in cell wall biosynthesis